MLLMPQNEFLFCFHTFISDYYLAGYRNEIEIKEMINSFSNYELLEALTIYSENRNEYLILLNN